MSALLIVDDHPVYRDALHLYLTRRFNAHAIEVFSASNISDGISLAKSKNVPWTILLDLSIPDSLDPLFGILEFKKLSNVTNIAAISGLEEDVWKEECLEAGCQIFISKNNDVEQIYSQIYAMMSAFLPEAVATGLTGRQYEILKCIAQGQSNKVIAYNFEIKEQTVKVHINAIFKELKVSNRVQAINKAKQLNLI